MDKPQCRVCPAKHWSHEPHKFPKVTNEPELVINEPLLVPTEVTNEVTNNSQKVLNWRKSNRERYNAYMRDYMRTKRDAQRQD